MTLQCAEVEFCQVNQESTH